MQAQCPQCSTRIQIDDAKVPERPFKVRCPKCQTLIALPGRAGEAPPAPAPAPDPQRPAEPDFIPSAEAIARQERLQNSQNDALVALSGPAASQIQQALTRIGFSVDIVEDMEEGARLLEQGAYEVAVTSHSPAAPGRPETLAQRMLRMAPEMRRRVFVVVVGDEFRSGDGVQAWAAQADLVVTPADAARCETLLRATMAERKRLYQPFADARARIESA